MSNPAIKQNAHLLSASLEAYRRLNLSIWYNDPNFDKYSESEAFYEEIEQIILSLEKLNALI